MTLDEFTWPNDVTLELDEIPIVYAKNLSHLMDNLTVDFEQTDAGDLFLVHSVGSDCC